MGSRRLGVANPGDDGDWRPRNLRFPAERTVVDGETETGVKMRKARRGEFGLHSQEGARRGDLFAR